MNLDIGDTRLIIDECKAYGCFRNQAAYILATAYWETARTMKPVKEAYWLSEAWRKKNLRYFPWYGRGYVQLTWKDNYVRATNELGIDFVARVDNALEPGPAAKVLVKGSMEGWFTGKKIGDYVTLQKSNFRKARRVINGTDKASEIARIAQDYDDALKAEGYGVTDLRPIPQPKTTRKPASGGLFAAIIKAILAIFGGKK
jgi:putative chitinase